MAENVERTSLVGLATMKSTTSRDGVDTRARRAAGKTMQSCGFDGFMKSFLGKGSSSKSSGWRNDSGSSGKSKVSFGMDDEEKKSLRRSMDKTVPAEEGAGDDVDVDVTAAAEEAAQMIWELLYGQGGVSDETFMEEFGLDEFHQLSGYMNGMEGYGGGLSGLGAVGMDMASLQDGIETANASAEMNNAAVLAELDGLLDGMPRDALEAALMHMAGGEEGGEGDLFNRIAAELDAQVVNVGGGEAGMLAWLGGNSVNYGQENSSGMVSYLPDESSADVTADSTNSFLFAEFLQEEAENSPINNLDSVDAETAQELLQRFSKWLESNGKSLDNNGLVGDVSGFVKMLAIGAGLSAGAAESGSGQIFSWAKSNLEALLQNDTNGGGNLTNMFASSESFRSLMQSILGETEEEFDFLSGNNQGTNYGHLGTQQAEAAKVMPANNASQVPMSTMLDQMENIERLAEAMRMNNKSGVKHLTMQLTPAEMGKVMLRVEAKDGVVSAYLRVEKPEAAAQLANNLAQLRENLKAQGIELGELTIQQRGQDEALGDFSGQRRQRDPGTESTASGTGRTARVNNNGDADTEAETADATGGGGPGGLNLFA